MFSQGGKTRLFFNGIGRRLDDDPAPVLYIGPTQRNIISVIEPKVDSMLRTCQALWAKTIGGKAYTKTKKLIAGVSLRFAWAGSPTELASDNACDVYVDEIDQIAKDVKRKGNVIELADARHNTFPDGKTIGASTPTEGNVDTEVNKQTGMEHWKWCDPEQLVSAIWSLWQDGTRHEWAWPCPDCHEYFIPRFKLLSFPSGSTASEAEKYARLACPECGSELESSHKDWMNERGVYVMPGQRPLAYRQGDKFAYLRDFTSHKSPGKTRKAKGVVSIEFGTYHVGKGVNAHDLTFWVSGLANWAVKKTFGELAMRWIRAVRSEEPEKIQGVLNTQFGELFKFSGEAPAWTEVLARTADYATGEVPEGVNLGILTVDVQKTHLVYVLRGWAVDGESWLIDYGQLYAESHDTSKPDVWEELEDVLRESQDLLPVAMVLVDSGYRRDEVYSFCRKHKGLAWPTKGNDNPGKPYWLSPQDVNFRGKRIKSGIDLWNFDEDLFKLWVHGRMNWKTGQPGDWHIPRDISEEYCRQIVAEHRIVTPSGRTIWKVVGANDYLDCEKQQPLAYRIIGKRIKRFARRAPKQQGDQREDEKIEKLPIQTGLKRPRRRKGGGFVGGFSE